MPLTLVKFRQTEGGNYMNNHEIRFADGTSIFANEEWWNDYITGNYDYWGAI